MATLYRQRKKYSKPRKAFDANRIALENGLADKYGLKNKREIWKAEAVVDKIREQAKKLITSPASEQEKFISRLADKGFIKKNSQIDDVLDLKVESILERRLQTIVLKKGLAKTSKGARQSIVHKHILLDKHVVNIPSYNVDVREEETIELRHKLNKKSEKKEESKEKENVA
jgi:small subunit ribosomal protein S4